MYCIAIATTSGTACFVCLRADSSQVKSTLPSNGAGRVRIQTPCLTGSAAVGSENVRTGPVKVTVYAPSVKTPSRGFVFLLPCDPG